jgi:preprotein translocase subunit SecD
MIEKATEDTLVEVKESKDKAITIDELLKVAEAEVDIESDATADTTGLVVDEELFAEKPFSSLLRQDPYTGMILVPERNMYAVKRILSDPEVQKLLPYDSKIRWSAKPRKLTMQDRTTENFYIAYHLNREAGLQGKYITEARETIGGMGSQTAGQSVVTLRMNNEGAKIFSRLTGSNIGKKLAIVLDDKVYMAPTISTKIPSGSAEITGLESIEEAKDIAIVLRAGALPAPVSIIEERTIGPSLGRDSIRTGALVGVIGFTIVIIFMFFYYKLSGLIADLALLLNIIFVLAILASFGLTLTLPGIAGLILTVGMAVDANVLIFERIREELDKGKTARAAIDSGYSRALTTILDANVTTIFAAIILMQFGSGPVKGFAVTLFWGILSSLFTAIFVTRTFFNWRTERKVLKTISI